MSQQKRKRYYKTLGTSLIDSQMSPSSLGSVRFFVTILRKQLIENIRRYIDREKFVVNLLIWNSFIGQFVHIVGEERMGYTERIWGVVILASYQHPNNNIYLF